MTKIYELLIIVFCALFITYHNFSFDDDNHIEGCMDSEALNYNSLATLDCCCEYRFKDKSKCHDYNRYEHPCLCTFNLKTDISCNQNSYHPRLYDIDSLNVYNISEDIHFNELVYSGFAEYYYSKLMEISQITYMDYYQVDGDNAIKNPQFLFFMSIEFLKRKNYKKSISYLNRFLDIPIEYEKNKYNEDKAYFIYYGCCDSDIAWLVNQEHKSYKIARILKSILVDLDNNVKESNILNNLSLLKDLDESDDTIDLIDNIIFSIIFSIDNPSSLLIDYRNDLLFKSNFLQVSNFNQLFEGSMPEYYLSSQIDILVLLKMRSAKDKIEYLYSNNSLNSLYDMESLMRYGMLQNIYNQGYNELDITSMIMHEYNQILNMYNQVEEKNNSDQNEIFNEFEEFMDLEDENLTNTDLLDNVSELDKYINKDRAKNIKDNWVKINTESPSLSIDDYSNIESFQHLILDEMRNIIDYNYFFESIDNDASYDHYPIILEKYKNKINLLKKTDMLSYEKKFYEIPYFYINPKDKQSNDIYSIYKYDLFVLDSFFDLLNLGDQNGAQKLKGDLIKRHSRSKGSSNLNIGYKSLLSSITLWQVVLPD